MNSQIEKYTREKELLLEQMKELVDEETRQNQQIEKLMDQEDVGIELFSPRNPDSKVKTQVENIRKHIDELQYKQAELTSRMDANQSMIDKWQKLLNEAMDKNDDAENKTSVLSDIGLGNPDEEKHVDADVSKEGTEKEKKEELEGSAFIKDYGHELREIQRRVNYCVAIIGKDRNKCKGELKALQYYINALMADTRKK